MDDLHAALDRIEEGFGLVRRQRDRLLRELAEIHQNLAGIRGDLEHVHLAIQASDDDDLLDAELALDSAMEALSAITREPGTPAD